MAAPGPRRSARIAAIAAAPPPPAPAAPAPLPPRVQFQMPSRAIGAGIPRRVFKLAYQVGKLKHEKDRQPVLLQHYMRMGAWLANATVFGTTGYARRAGEYYSVYRVLRRREQRRTVQAAGAAAAAPLTAAQRRAANAARRARIRRLQNQVVALHGALGDGSVL